MANLHILTDDWVLEGTFSGGDWEPTLPLDRLKDAIPATLARSTDAALVNTQFVVDLGRALSVSMFFLIGHNLSSAATIRFRLSASSNLSSPLIDETVNAINPNIVWGSMPWGAFPWTGVDADDQPGGAITFHKHASTQFGRYIGVNIADTTNPDGYVEAKVFKAGDAFVSSINMAWGVRWRFVDPSEQSRTYGGQKYTDIKPKYRVCAAELEFLSETEAWGSIYEIQRKLGISGGLMIVYDPDDDGSIILRRTMYASLTRLDDIVTARPVAEYPYSWSFEAEELL